MRRRDFIVAVGGVIVSPPIAARAQKPIIPVVGYLGAVSQRPNLPFTAAFIRGLVETGFTEGRDFIVDYRWAEGNLDRLPALAAELVSDQVAVIFASGGFVSARAAMQATSSIPIVFSIGDDPVRLGLVSSINRPTGNVTGVTFNFTVLGAKRWELLHEMVPKAGVVAVLVAPDSATSVLEGRQVEEVARTNGRQVLIFSARTGNDIESALANSIEQHADALLVTGSPFFGQEREQIVTLAARHSLPAIYYEREFVVAGGLMSYGVPLRDNYHQAGVYVGQLLKGAKPSDLPVVQGTKIELVINLKTAKQLNLSVPLTMQMTADEVIE